LQLHLIDERKKSHCTIDKSKTEPRLPLATLSRRYLFGTMATVPDLSLTLDHTGKSFPQIIKDEHELVRNLLHRYRNVGDSSEKQGLAYNIIKLLSTHSAAEEEVWYPMMTQKMPNGNQLTTHAPDEHQQLKETLYWLDSAKVGDEGFDRDMDTAYRFFREHAQDEETKILPTFEKACTAEELRQLADDFISAKKMVPTRPHPSAPNKPPANKVANRTALPIDMAADLMRFSGSGSVPNEGKDVPIA